MCRLFALHAHHPIPVASWLWSAPHSLVRQSERDGQGWRHDSGWGISHYPTEQPWLLRSAQAVYADPAYAALAQSLRARALVAHVRLASAGGVAERNSHPFAHGPWTFAHNGTLFGFAKHPERLRALIAPGFRPCIQGETDSEHAFYFLLSRLYQELESEGKLVSIETMGRVLGETVRLLASLFPGEGEELSQLNFVLTNGRLLAASRWRHSLYRLTLPALQAVAVASEPTATSEPWHEVPDRTVLLIHEDLTQTLLPIAE